MKNALLFFGSLLLASSAQAAAFHVGTQDAKATGLAMAVTADVDDPSALLYNPAGLAQGAGLQLRLGDTVIIPSFTAKLSRGDNTTKQDPVPPPHFYLSYGLNEEATVGIGVFIPFGMSVAWQDGWQGRYQSTSTALLNYVINPEVAYKFFNRVRVGAGIQVVRSTIDLQKNINLLDSDATLELAAGAWGVGGNLGLQVILLDKSSGYGQLNFGAAYRSTVTLAYRDGKAHFGNVAAEFQGQLKDQAGSTTLTLPQILALGISYRYGGFRIGIDAEYTGWQSVGEIKLEFTDPALNTTIVKRFHHTWNFHVGAEYAVTDNVIVRLGALYDPSPNPTETLSPDLPDADRVNLAAGLGLRFGCIGVDLGYQHVFMLETESTFAPLPATYGGGADVIGLTLGYKM